QRGTEGAGRAGREKALRARGAKKKKAKKKQNPAISDDRSRQHDGKHRMLRAQFFRHETSDRRNRPAVLHQLSEYRSEQKKRKELAQKCRSAAHEGLCPVRQ